jgi:hypothetical protein
MADATDINPNLLLLAGLGVVAYLVWQNYQAQRPKGGSDGAPGGLAGTLGDLVAGGAPVGSSDDVTALPWDAVHAQTIQLTIVSPVEGGDVTHTPLRNTFPLRLYIDNWTGNDVTDVLRIAAKSDANYIPSGVDEYSTTMGPLKVPAFGRRYVQVPVNFAGEFSVGPLGWQVELVASFGGGDVSQSFTVH